MHPSTAFRDLLGDEAKEDNTQAELCHSNGYTGAVVVEQAAALQSRTHAVVPPL